MSRRRHGSGLEIMAVVDVQVIGVVISTLVLCGAAVGQESPLSMAVLCGTSIVRARSCLRQESSVRTTLPSLEMESA